MAAEQNNSAVKNDLHIRPIPGWWSFPDVAALFGIHRNSVHYLVFQARAFGDPQENVGAAGARIFMIKEEAVRALAEERGCLQLFERMRKQLNAL